MRDAGARRPRDDVAAPDLDRFPLRLVLQDIERRGPELERRAALEEDEQLLVGRMAVRWRTVMARFEAPIVHPGVLRARLARKEHPAACLAFVGGLGVGDIDRARR